MDGRHLDEQSRRGIEQLRDEVARNKECITQHMLHVLAFCGAATGVVTGLQLTTDKGILIGWSGLFILLLLRAVSRTAIHKLGTINRILGYQLCLERRRTRAAAFLGPLGWEEAMNAWRVVQATVFATMCEPTDGFRLGRYRPEYAPRRHRPLDARFALCWYDAPSLVAAAASTLTSHVICEFHAGNYAKKILAILHLAMFGCLLPLGSIMVYSRGASRLELASSALMLVVAVALVFHARARDLVRMDQLEHGILSIASSAVLWDAVTAAHHAAAHEAGQSAPNGWHETYMHVLTRRAADLAGDPWGVPRWIERTWSELADKLASADEARLAAPDSAARGPEVTKVRNSMMAPLLPTSRVPRRGVR
jgi:hypothetical protein